MVAKICVLKGKVPYWYSQLICVVVAYICTVRLGGGVYGKVRPVPVNV